MQCIQSCRREILNIILNANVIYKNMKHNIMWIECDIDTHIGILQWAYQYSYNEISILTANQR